MIQPPEWYTERASRLTVRVRKAGAVVARAQVFRHCNDDAVDAADAVVLILAAPRLLTALREIAQGSSSEALHAFYVLAREGLE